MPKRTHKLTSAQRHQIARRLKSNGASPAALAREFKVSVGSINSIARVRGVEPERAGLGGVGPAMEQRRRSAWEKRVERMRLDGRLTNMLGFPL